MADMEPSDIEESLISRRAWAKVGFGVAEPHCDWAIHQKAPRVSRRHPQLLFPHYPSLFCQFPDILSGFDKVSVLYLEQNTRAAIDVRGILRGSEMNFLVKVSVNCTILHTTSGSPYH
jgi:hypothetical protein